MVGPGLVPGGPVVSGVYSVDVATAIVVDRLMMWVGFALLVLILFWEPGGGDDGDCVG